MREDLPPATPDEFPFADDIGPRRVVYLTEPAVGLHAAVVVDNVAAGPAIGGVRMAADVTIEECFRLARAMTLKNAAAGLPHGGGKAVIVADAASPRAVKEPLVRAFATLIGELDDYIAGPDMGTDETCMAWIHDEIGRAVGLPRELGGIPLDELGATGFGLAAAVDLAAEHCQLDLRGARVVVQGFGAVGTHAARFLAERGTVLVGVADSGGAIVDPHGLDLDALVALKRAGGTVAEAPFGEPRARDEIVDVACEVWVPAARPDVITVANVERLQARIVAQGANIPVTPEAEIVLHERGILSLPDFIANAGGVICASVEYHGGTEGAAFETIAERITRNTRTVLDRARERAISPRAAALELAEERVRHAMDLSRWH